MKTRIEVQIIKGEEWYAPQVKIDKEPYKYLTESKIGIFFLDKLPTKFNFISGAEKMIDRYLELRGIPNKKSKYIKYP